MSNRSEKLYSYTFSTRELFNPVDRSSEGCRFAKVELGTVSFSNPRAKQVKKGAQELMKRAQRNLGEYLSKGKGKPRFKIVMVTTEPVFGVKSGKTTERLRVTWRSIRSFKIEKIRSSGISQKLVDSFNEMLKELNRGLKAGVKERMDKRALDAYYQGIISEEFKGLLESPECKKFVRESKQEVMGDKLKKQAEVQSTKRRISKKNQKTVKAVDKEAKKIEKLNHIDPWAEVPFKYRPRVVRISLILCGLALGTIGTLNLREGDNTALAVHNLRVFYYVVMLWVRGHSGIVAKDIFEHVEKTGDESTYITDLVLTGAITLSIYAMVLYAIARSVLSVGYKSELVGTALDTLPYLAFTALGYRRSGFRERIGQRGN